MPRVILGVYYWSEWRLVRKNVIFSTFGRIIVKFFKWILAEWIVKNMPFFMYFQTYKTAISNLRYAQSSVRTSVRGNLRYAESSVRVIFGTRIFGTQKLRYANLRYAQRIFGTQEKILQQLLKLVFYSFRCRKTKKNW